MGKDPELKFKVHTHGQSELMNILISIKLPSNSQQFANKACPKGSVTLTDKSS